MDNKVSMLEAVKRKRMMLQQHEQDLDEPGGQATGDDDGELAPSGSAGKDALLGKPGGKDTLSDAETSAASDNETQLGQEGGFNKVVHNSPANSKNLFQNPKKDTHDATDPNLNRNMAGADGENNQHDEMGVNIHQDVRKQSSNMAAHNMAKAEAIKKASVGKTKSDMAMPNIQGLPPSSNKDAAPDEEVNDAPRLSPMKSARAKVDGYLSKFKKS